MQHTQRARLHCSYDAIVVGLGAHGSAALYSLAKQGAKVRGSLLSSQGRGVWHVLRLITLAARSSSCPTNTCSVKGSSMLC